MPPWTATSCCSGRSRAWCTVRRPRPATPTRSIWLPARNSANLHFVEPMSPHEAHAALRRGAVIPAHLLALDAQRKLDERRQRALTRYYVDAGAGGLAVGVHATQFAIREAGLYEPVLRLAMEESKGRVPMIAGLAGKTAQAKKEAGIARALGYHAGMLSLGAMKGASLDELIAHCTAIAAEMPLVGFYLQPAVGGIPL